MKITKIHRINGVETETQLEIDDNTKYTKLGIILNQIDIVELNDEELQHLFEEDKK